MQKWKVVCEEDILHTGVDISCVTVEQPVARIRRICPGVLLKSDEHVFVPQFRFRHPFCRVPLPAFGLLCPVQSTRVLAA
jgi:hypothetical protein